MIMALSLEMRVSAANKKMAALRQQRGDLAIGDDNSKFEVVSAQIGKVERDIQQLQNALKDAADARARKEAIEAPKKRAAAHAALLASLKSAEAERLATIGAAEVAARALVDALKAAMTAAARTRAVADEIKVFNADTSPMDGAAMLNASNISNRLSLLLSSVLSPLCTAHGFFGLVNFSAAGHQRVDASASWKILEEREISGLIAAFARAR